MCGFRCARKASSSLYVMCGIRWELLRVDCVCTNGAGIGPSVSQLLQSAPISLPIALQEAKFSVQRCMDFFHIHRCCLSESDREAIGSCT
eukprot:IDg6725t1